MPGTAVRLSRPRRASGGAALAAAAYIMAGCSQPSLVDSGPEPASTPAAPGVAAWTTLDLAHLDNYAHPDLPPQYRDPDVDALDNARTAPITDAGATLGRVLFFDKRLSVNGTIACAGCHIPSLGFTDSARFSTGLDGGPMPVHTMRLANARWYAGPGFFWDRRAPTIEAQTTQPIASATEMGWDSTHGGLDGLLTRMGTLPYYPELFAFVYGDSAITVDRLQRALAMYVRSMLAVRSRWDVGYAQNYDPSLPDKGLLADVPGLTVQQNLGRSLFIRSRDQGGFGCAQCHLPPTFSLIANSKSNGITPNETTIFKAPSLKNVAVTGPYMHNGRFNQLELVIAFYGGFTNPGPALDDRLKEPDGSQLQLHITAEQREAVAAFLGTLTDSTLLTDPRFTSPFRAR
jgi:cytochrome c peroxidase